MENNRPLYLKAVSEQQKALSVHHSPEQVYVTKQSVVGICNVLVAELQKICAFITCKVVDKRVRDVNNKESVAIRFESIVEEFLKHLEDNLNKPVVRGHTDPDLLAIIEMFRSNVDGLFKEFQAIELE